MASDATPKSGRRLLVIPHGTGIGDLVNLRPILEAIGTHYQGWQLQVAVPESLRWLLPSPFVPAVPTAMVRRWRRMEPDHPASVLLGKLSVRSTAGLFSPSLLLPVAAGFGAYARLPHRRYRRYDRVINLLEAFLEFDLDQRWTPGAWSRERVHIIDLLAAVLEGSGIYVPVECRRPVLRMTPQPLAGSPVIILAPNAGSTLKEVSVQTWVAVAQQLVALGITPYLLAAPRRDTVPDISRQVPALPVIEQPDLREVTRILAGADMVVAPDTGVLHLAAALGTRYVGLFGSTDPYFLGPYDRNGGIILSTTREHLPICRRCWTAQFLPAARCPVFAPENCLSGIAPERIVAGICEQLTVV